MHKHKIFCFLLGLFLSLCFLSQCNSLCVNTPAKAIDLPSGGHFMTAAETRSFIGDSFPVSYYTNNGVVETMAHYDSIISGQTTSELSETPVGFVTNNNAQWLLYTVSVSSVSTVPTEITCSLQPTYSIFDTEFVYTCLALSSGNNSSGVPSSSTYYSPTSNWYIGGSINNFRNSTESYSNSGVHSSMSFGYSFRFTYVPIAFSSQHAFSAYCVDANFYGNSPSLNTTYYFAVMCPYVSGSATGGVGSFTTNSGQAGGSVDLSETNSLLGDILNGLAPISVLVDVLTDDSDIPAAGTIVEMPYDNEDYDEMLMTADAILDDIPDTVAAASFWVEITNAFFPENSWLRVIMPLLMIMALMSWLLWKK